MREAIILFSIIVCSAKIFSQPAAIEKKFPEKYFIDNKDSLNSIEGSWNVNIIQEYYHHDTLFDVVKPGEPLKVAVIKNEGKFQSYLENGDPYETDFIQTDVKGVYLYRIFFTGIKKYSGTRAIIVKDGEMEYTYDLPISQAKEENPDGRLRVVKILKWTKNKK